MRQRRLWIVATVMWCLAFTQAAAAAHACAMMLSALPGQSMEANAQPMPPDCTGMAKQTNSTANICAAHCLDGQQVNGQVDVPGAAIAPQPALTVRVAEPRASASLVASSLLSPSATPPPQLRFSRFLI